ncbi:peptidase S10, serine carboxypeptidase [Coemansia reversa NRRL 1564]|uniref:Carboxypeptidase n=1 Tax=Coemansia reversa (strain ATCC 12441 / NRRL 1564) TaxID=763665 RepID=A0A2G5BBE7_COERN|nr:peptidase S10, serine carboxypeptidase [Coemansia reversa NRRL 1564]|eukprot:PIA16344.1 peptidase S10, serine carboxypeptidase [Coemansia reversa NRRL 1564]
MDAISNYQLRVKSPELCDTNVTQYSGYLDTAEDKHFFFWFFEARNVRREKVPLILWLNGGPGCSSFTGLLMELGPCRAGKGGNHTVYNPFAWNDGAHILFLDQPTNVGFSYGADVFNSIAAGKDVHALLQLFYKEFPEYAQGPLHVFGESYGGHYVPAIAKAIHDSNRELRVLPLSSIGIGNGFVNPLVQHKYYSKMACNSTYPAVFSSEKCAAMDAAYPKCAQLTQACYRWRNALACLPASEYCERNIAEVYTSSGRSYYDVRLSCGENEDACYPIMDDIDRYLNDTAIQKELGAEVSAFVSCSEKVFTGFWLNGDESKPFHQYIPPLLAGGIRVLVYAGDADYICNWYGNKAWSLEMEWPGKQAFNAAEDKKWHTTDFKHVGEVRESGNFTFIRIFGAGHMVPYDQPVAALDMVNRWLDHRSFTLV